jgi:hypothetical protein
MYSDISCQLHALAALIPNNLMHPLKNTLGPVYLFIDVTVERL